MYNFDMAGVENPLETALECARQGVFLETGSQLGRLILAYANHLTDDMDSFHEEAGIALSLNPCGPAWFHAGYVIEHLLRDDYERGLAVTRTNHPFISYWDDLVIAAMLGQLKRTAEARACLEVAGQQKPDIDGRAAELMRRGLKIDGLVKNLIDELLNAGLRV
jgi:hypothetical protein